MADIARDRCNAHQGEAKQKMIEWLANDRRFDQYDKERLVERVNLCRYNGATLDLDDPQLKRPCTTSGRSALVSVLRKATGGTEKHSYRRG